MSVDTFCLIKNHATFDLFDFRLSTFICFCCVATLFWGVSGVNSRFLVCPWLDTHDTFDVKSPVSAHN
jgi:hypothetical protein